MSTLATTLALAALLPQQAVEHPLPPRAEQPPGVIAVVGATLHTVSGPPVEDGIMLVEAGRIRAIGVDVVVPDGARVIDLAGMTVMPGIVDSHSHMGLKQLYRPETGSDNNELSKPINARSGRRTAWPPRILPSAWPWPPGSPRCTSPRAAEASPAARERC